MADPFVSEIRIFGFNFAPKGWAFCQGQLLPITQNTALFALLGTNYGGDGKSTFGLPNLQAAAPMFWGQGPGLTDYNIGETGGSQNVTLHQSEIQAHNHQMLVSADQATERQPQGQNFSQGVGVNFYDVQNANTQMNPAALSVAGGSLPHNNMQPYLVLNFCIAMQGVFPPRP